MQDAPIPRPWFREPMVWLIIALPSAAVLGCIVTIAIALAHPAESVGAREHGFAPAAGGSAAQAARARVA